MVDKITQDIVIDTEFNDEVGDYRIEPWSFGLVAVPDVAHEFYVVSSQINEARAHKFLKEHVLPKLFLEAAVPQPPQQIVESIKHYLESAVKIRNANRVELWAQNGANDQSLLGLAFGGLSKFYTFMNSIGVERTYFRNILDLKKELGFPELSSAQAEETRHNALFDARYEAQILMQLKAIKAAKIHP